MWTALIDVLPYTIGLVLTPFALIASIVLLVSDNGTRKGLALVAVWLLATFGVCLLIAEVSAGTVHSEDTPGFLAGLIVLLVGCLLLFVAIRMIRKVSKRPLGMPRKPPGWLAAADHLSLAQIILISLALAVANPVNLSMLIGAGVTLGEYNLGFGEAAIVTAIFACFGAIGVLVPTVVAIEPRLRERVSLDRWRAWLIEHNDALTIGTTLVFGVLFISKGLRGLV